MCKNPWARGFGPADDGVCKLLQHSLYKSHIRRVPGISVAFGSIVPQTPGELGRQCEPSRRQQERLSSLQQVHRLAPTWVKLQRLACFSGALLLSPALLFFHVCVWGAVLIQVLGSFPNLVINLMLQKDVLDTLVLHPRCTERSRCICWFEKCVEM